MDWLIAPFELTFQQRALVGGSLAAIALALVGTWVVIRGMTFLGDALVHGVIPGIALAVLLDFNVMVGAGIAAAVMILGINLVHRQTAFSEDTGIGLLFVGMLALGVILISRTASYSGSLTGILFGDALGVSGNDVKVLDGGIPAWVAAGHPLTTEVPRPDPATLTIRDPRTRTLDREAIASRLGTLTILDARSPERYRGDEEPIDPVAGHVPTAINAPYEDNLDAHGLFLPPAELRDRFGALGAEDPDTVIYCGSGVTACHDIVAIVAAGLPEPILYPGSWSDWSSSGMDVATGG